MLTTRPGPGQSFALGDCLKKPALQGIILAPRYNAHGNDAAGAFHPGAEAFARIHGLPTPVYFDNARKWSHRRKEVVHDILTAAGKAQFDVVAYFGHGLPHALSSAGFDEKQLALFAGAILAKANTGVTVLLYACWSGATHGFAEKLATALVSKNAVVYGHSTRGHSFVNPHVTVHPGGHPVISPHDPLWKKWRHALAEGDCADPATHPFWAQFPFLSFWDLRKQLQAWQPSNKPHHNAARRGKHK